MTVLRCVWLCSLRCTIRSLQCRQGRLTGGTFLGGDVAAGPGRNFFGINLPCLHWLRASPKLYGSYSVIQPALVIHSSRDLSVTGLSSGRLLAQRTSKRGAGGWPYRPARQV